MGDRGGEREGLNQCPCAKLPTPGRRTSRVRRPRPPRRRGRPGRPKSPETPERCPDAAISAPFRPP